MDDLSDESARRRIFRGVHRAPKPFEDEADPPPPHDDPHADFRDTDFRHTDLRHTDLRDADATEPFGGLVPPGAYHDEDPDPYRDAPPLLYAAHGQDHPAADALAQDDAAAEVEDALSVPPLPLLHQHVRPAGRPNRPAAPVRPPVPLDPPPDVQDALRAPSRHFGSREAAPDVIDTLKGESILDGVAPAHPGHLPRAPGFQHSGPPAGERHGYPPPRRDRADAPPAWVNPDPPPRPNVHPAASLPAAQGLPEPSFTLSYARQDGDSAPGENQGGLGGGDQPRDRDPAGPARPHTGADGRAAAPSDDAGSGVEGATGRSGPHAPAAGQTGESPPTPSETRSPAGSADEDADPAPVRRSDTVRTPFYKIAAAVAALTPALAAAMMLYLKPDILETLEEISGFSSPAPADRSADAAAPAGGPAGASQAPPQAGVRPDGEARQPALQAPEIEAQLKGSALGVPKLANDPLPLLTAIPSAESTAPDERDDAQAASEGAPTPRAQASQEPDGAPPATPQAPTGMSAPPADQAGTVVRPARRPAPDEGRRAATAPLPDPPQADAETARAQRALARRNRSRPATPDDTLTVKAERLLAAGEILAARTLFQSLVTAGDPRGARGVAQTFDPRVVERFPTSGVKPNPDEAARWQAIAARLESRQRRNPGEASP